MKRFLLCALLAMGVNASADTYDTKSFAFDGVKTTDSFAMTSQKDHTEYQYQTVNDTCYRQDLIGYQTQCDTVYETVCSVQRICQVVNGVRVCSDQNVCQQVPRQSCYQVPVYQTVAYTCQKTISVPYTVKDFDVQANVQINYGPAPAGLKVKENFGLELSGDALSLSDTTARSGLLVFENHTDNENLAGGLKTMDVTFNLSFMNAADLAGPLSSNPKNIALINGDTELVWDTSLISHPEFFTISLYIQKDGNVLLNQELPLTAFTLTNSSKGTHFSSTLQALGVTRSVGTYQVSITLASNVDTSSVLNSGSLPSSRQVSASGKVKVK